MSVKISPLTVTEAISLAIELQQSTPEVSRDFHDIFGSKGCLLGCDRTTGSSKDDDGVVEETNQDNQMSELVLLPKRVRKRAKWDAWSERDKAAKWFTIQQIRSSALSGCGSCEIVSEFLPFLFPENIKSASEFKYRVSGNHQIWMRRDQDDESKKTVIPLFQVREGTEKIKNMPRANVLGGRASSMKRLRTWLDDCTNTHQHCAQYDKSEKYSEVTPARLIDVTPRESGSLTGVRIIETVSEKEYRYVCLSHRWGKKSADCRTTTDKILQSLEFLETRQLPKNFTDAIEVTREIGIRYIWIDSLCIVQDDGEDVERELVKMGSIYENAHLTISAVWANPDDGRDDGCFQENEIVDICFRLTGLEKEKFIVGARMLGKRAQPSTIKAAISKFPLFTRGWVFQERLLSKRILLCFNGEFAFECLTHGECECRCLSIPPHQKLKESIGHNAHERVTDTIKSIWFNGLKHRQQLKLPWSSNWQVINNDWWDLVSMYAALNLSVETDMLPAIAGCAQAMARRLGHNYIAGLWKQTLGVDLLWVVQGRQRHERILKSRSTHPGAPSWSWACLQPGQQLGFSSQANGGKKQKNEFFLAETIKEIHCPPVHEGNIFGRVQAESSYLRLDASLYAWYIRRFCTKAVAPRNRHRIYDFHCSRSSINSACATDVAGLAITGVAVEYFPDALGDEDIESIPVAQCQSDPPKPCLLFPIYLLHGAKKEADSIFRDIFLVLKVILPLKEGLRCYKRIGFLRLTSNKEQREIFFHQLNSKGQPSKQGFYLF